MEQKRKVHNNFPCHIGDTCLLCAVIITHKEAQSIQNKAFASGLVGEIVRK